MPVNEGFVDRSVRGSVGLVLVVLALATTLFAAPLLWWGALIVGAVLLVTAVTGFCPAYRLIGIKTCSDC